MTVSFPGPGHRRGIAASVAFAAYFLAAQVFFGPIPAWSASFLERAQQYFEEGDLPAATVELKNALQREPDDADARFLLGRVYLQVGNLEAAEKELLRAEELGYQGDDLDLAMSSLRLRQGRYADVALDPTEAIELDSEVKKDLYAARASALLGLGQVDEASAIFDRILSDGPHIHALLGKARVSMVVGQPDTARGYLDRAVDLEPDNPELLFVDGFWMFQERRFEEAKERFTRATQADPGRLRGYLGIIQANLATGDVEAAHEQVRALVAAQPENLLILLVDSIVQFFRGDFQAAKIAADSVLGRRSGQPQALLVAGYSAYRLGEYEQARTRLSAYLSDNPADQQVRMTLGAALLRLGYSDEAYEVARSTEIEVPDNAAYLSVLASAAFGAEDRQAGMRYLEALAARTPDNANILEQLGVARAGAGDAAGGVEALERAIALDPQRLSSYRRLFLLRLTQDDLDGAFALAKSVETLFPDQGDSHTMHGLAYLTEGDPESAKTAFTAALQVEPDDLEAADNLVNLHEAEGDLASARAVLDDVLASDGSNLPVLLRYAALEYGAGDVPKAIELLAAASTAHPSAVEPKIRLGRLLLDTGDFARLEKEIRDVLEVNPDNSALLALMGSAKLQLGKPQEAVAMLERLIRQVPRNAEARYLLASAYGLQERRESTIRQLDWALDIDPDHIKARVAKARILVNARQLNRAKPVVEALVRDHPTNFEALAIQAELALLQGDAELAIDRLTVIHKLVRGADSTRMLARGQWQAGAHEDSLATLEDWLAESPADVANRWQAGAYYLALGRSDDGLRHFRAILDVEPDDWRANNQVAWLLNDQGQSAAALPYAERARRLAPDNADVADTLGVVLWKQGALARAQTLLAEATEKSPDNPEIAFNYAQVLAQNGATAASRRVLERALSTDTPFREREAAERFLETLQD